jgi:AcrR family transcriptional regulator
MEGRRARLRAHLLGEIKGAALEELRRTGAAALSLREVARAAGISPSGLYRYVDGRDGLLELLISDGFENLGRAVQSAIDTAGDDVVAQLEAAAFGYHRWARDNPEQFGLILGTPVPGFHASPAGPTVEGVRRFSEPMIRVVASTWAFAHPSVLPDLVSDTGDLPGEMVRAIVRCWSRLHGLVCLDTFGHLEWSGIDVEELLRAEVRSIVDELGLSRELSPRPATH